MSTEEIQQVFLNTDSHYDVDLKNSKLKGEAFITYIANMQINCSLANVEGTASEEKLEVLKHYLTFRQSIKCDTLLHTTARTLMRFAGVTLDKSFCDWMSLEEIDSFIVQNSDMLNNVANFIYSAPVFVTSFNNNFREEIFKPAIESGEIRVIDDPDIVGINTINLFSIPDFTEFFIAAVSENPNNANLPMYYYKAQVERLQYDRKTIFDIFLGLKGDSFLMAFSNLLLNTSENGEELALLEKYAAED